MQQGIMQRTRAIRRIKCLDPWIANIALGFVIIGFEVAEWCDEEAVAP